MKGEPASAPSDRERIEAALAGFRGDHEGSDPLVSEYALADALLRVETDDEPFHERFGRNYGECAVAHPDRPPDVVFGLRSVGPGAVRASYATRRASLPAGFPVPFLPEPREVRPSPRPGWSTARISHPVGHVGFDGTDIVVERSRPWPALLSSIAVNVALSVQPQVLFFHGAALGIRGRGVLLLGVSGAGKTSVSLALAARGHDFYGDDIVGVRLESRALVPLRRAAHVRAGPAAPEVAGALGGPAEDGARRLAEVSSLFPGAGVGDGVLDFTVCLRRFAPETRLVPFEPKAEHLRWVTPHVGSLHAGRPAARAMRVATLFSRSPCFFLDSASPQSAADALEQLAE